MKRSHLGHTLLRSDQTKPLAAHTTIPRRPGHVLRRGGTPSEPGLPFRHVRASGAHTRTPQSRTELHGADWHAWHPTQAVVGGRRCVVRPNSTTTRLTSCGTSGTVPASERASASPAPRRQRDDGTHASAAQPSEASVGGLNATRSSRPLPASPLCPSLCRPAAPPAPVSACSRRSAAAPRSRPPGCREL